jgi:hypothetical protein
MAGWDGDALAESMEQALERQQEAAEARRAQSRQPSSQEERGRKERDESVRLSRARLEGQLERATNPAHRAMLERALKSLEATSAGAGAGEEVAGEG